MIEREVERSFIETQQNVIERLREELREEDKRTKPGIEVVVDLEKAVAEDTTSLKGLEKALENLLSKRSEQIPNRGSQLKAVKSTGPTLGDRMKDARMMEEMGDRIPEYRKELKKWLHLQMLSTAAFNYLKTTKGKEEFSLQTNTTLPEEIPSSVAGQPNGTPSNIVPRPDSNPEIPETDLTMS